MSNDTVDISLEDVVTQYREELTKVTGEKLLLQAAVKILGEKQTELISQIAQMSEDLASSATEIGRLNDIVEKAAAAAAPEEGPENAPLRPALATAQHIPYTLGQDGSGE